ncbi:conjugative transposon protein TraM [Echinicola rosea]|uniref:Conjugative transposon protein TraM n=1 Tax=Echinicola rosea TaxID=1807691 RepID=A0ABQ1UT00_9BACT|nr:conjugative transposon protein TraM [Echinicola rosea]GGF24251.1 conjugative transposon protein TraM [Echinicola rosea]
MKRPNTRQRTLLLVLPLFVLPLALAFAWAGQGLRNKDDAERLPIGLRADLPGPQLETRELGKMELYQKKARADQRKREMARMDPYLREREQPTAGKSGELLPLSKKGSLDHRATELMEKLEQLDRQLVRPREGLPPESSPHRPAPVKKEIPSGLERDIAQLEGLMDRMQPNGPDPEIQQLEGMLEKILDVQHPERVRERLREKQLEKARFTVEKETKWLSEKKESDPKETRGQEQNAFYGLEGHSPVVHVVEPAIAAEIAEETVLEREGRIKLKLLEKVRVNGMEYPSGSIVYGRASLDGDRVKLVVSSLRSGNHILPVSLEAYDQDAMAGIPISGNLGKELQQGAGDALVTGLPNMSSGMTLETQIASAGVSAAKGLFRKKKKAIKITLKAGHPILLVNTENA